MTFNFSNLFGVKPLRPIITPEIAEYDASIRTYAAKLDDWLKDVNAKRTWEREKEVKMPPLPTDLFTVYRASNGFYAQTKKGALVVGMTLSECCTAAQAAIAEEALTPEDDGDAPDAAKQGWQKVR